jgi:CTP synthase (UTP-ammonia lyase)
MKVIPPAIAILGEYSAAFEPHTCTDAAIGHSNAESGAMIRGEWMSTSAIEVRSLRAFSGIWVARGSPYRDMGKTLEAIRYARENGVPCLGTCGGMQHITLEYARNVLGYKDAQHAEYDPYASDLFVSRLACSLRGREMRLQLVPGSLVSRIYGGTSATERYYCDFGVSSSRVEVLRSGALRIVGSDDEGAVRVVELPEHPFFVGTLYVPQARSRPGAPHPLVSAFLQAAASRSCAAQ